MPVFLYFQCFEKPILFGLRCFQNLNYFFNFFVFNFFLEIVLEWLWYMGTDRAYIFWQIWRQLHFAKEPLYFLIWLKISLQMIFTFCGYRFSNCKQLKICHKSSNFNTILMMTCKTLPDSIFKVLIALVCFK